MDPHIAPRYVLDNYKPSDRLAVVLIQKRTGIVTQRLSSAERVASPAFQAWLRHKNAQNHEVYISMNTLRGDAHGRTKEDIEAIRHIYLDFDHDGTAAVERLLARRDLPPPNYRLSSSPGKWQVSWKVEGFTLDQAERLQRALARETGADPAATDAARVMRLPGFFSHKYPQRHLVSAEKLSDGIYYPEDFPVPARDHNNDTLVGDSDLKRSLPRNGLSQSERDWAFAKRALARGEPEDLVTLAIAVLRKGEKHNVAAYAERTVQNAARSLAAERMRTVQYPAR